MKVFWTETAVENLSAIYTYIAQNSPRYATRIIDRITKRSQQLANFPLSGRIVPEFETEQIREVIEVHIELSITSSPNKLMYLLLYTGHRKLHQV